MMRARATADRFDLDDDRVAVAGDWHGDRRWSASALHAARRAGFRTVLHVGDFALWDASFFDTIDYAAQRAPGGQAIDRVLVTPGNHEHWGELSGLFDKSPGRAVQLSDAVWALPRGFRFTVGGRAFTSVGGAPSVDLFARRQGVTWWPEEAITDDDVERVIRGGATDVLIAHDTVDGSGVEPIERILAGNPLGWPAEALAYAAQGRARLTRIWEALEPKVMFHGHYHVRGSGNAKGRRVEALAMNGMPGNLVELDTRTLVVAPLVADRA